MKNKKVLIIAMAAVMSATGLAGCGSKTDEDSKAQSKAETSAAVSESTEQEENQIENKDVPETDVTTEISERLKNEFPFITADGKALPTYAENAKAIDNETTHTIAELSYENIDSAENKAANLYTFTMSSAQSPQEIEGIYVMNFKSADEEDYYVELGDTATSQLADAEIYAPNDTEITYFAYGMVLDSGKHVLVPIIAGNDEMGYYFVRTNLKMLGYDVDGIAIPESGKIGVDNSQINV